MPHVVIKHFPADLTESRSQELVAALTAAVTQAFEVGGGAVSIALEPVARQDWDELVYQPEIVQRQELLLKKPNY
jgi:4-oxalocrotonate tautomerase